MTTALLQQSLDALEGVLDDAKDLRNASISGGCYEVVQCRDAIRALRAALAQPEQPASAVTAFTAYETYLKNGSVCVAPLFAGRYLLRSEVESALARPKQLASEAQPEWKEAVINELIIGHIYSAVHETDPRKAVQDVISWNCSVVLDPSISSDAQALIDRGREQAKREDAEPVAMAEASGEIVWIADEYPLNDTPLYLVPPNRQPMTDWDIDHILFSLSADRVSVKSHRVFARAIEAHYGIGKPK